MEIVKVLNGHSGCQVELCRDGPDHFIRKIAKDAGYSPRLIRQIEKQQRLSAIIPVPAVLSTNFEEIPARYTMEYIGGLDFKQACLGRPMSWIDQFVTTLFEYLEKLHRSPINLSLAPLFQTKIRGIRQALASNVHCDYSRLTGILTQLENYDFSHVPGTESHGDMTMENIIFRSDLSIAFIDVLDGELETVWLDIAKLLYDLEVGWSLRKSLWHDHHGAEERLLSMLSRYLSEEILIQVERNFSSLMAHLPALKAVQALRVLPYSHDAITVERLTNYINSMNL